MSRSVFVILMSLVCVCNSRADDIRLRTGEVLKNCQVIDTVGNRIEYRTTADTLIRHMPISAIDEIVISPFDPKVPTMVIGTDGSLRTFGEILDGRKIQVSRAQKEAVVRISQREDSLSRRTYPNLVLLPLAAVALAIGWDCLAEASNLTETIDSEHKFLPLLDTSPLESDRSRKRFVGLVSLAAGLATIWFAAQPQEMPQPAGARVEPAK
jgi:hypothetical protein